MRLACCVTLLFAFGAWGQSDPAWTLFSFDDRAIPFRDNLKVTLEQPRKYPGNPVLRHGPPGSVDAQRAQFYGSVRRVGGKFRMWYAACATEETVGARGTSFRIAYAESQDGLKWVKPELGLVEFGGNKRNNLVSFSPPLDETMAEPLAAFVLHEPEDPDPARRYKMARYTRYYNRGDAKKTPHATILPFFSADGLRWTLALPPPKTNVLDETEVPFRAHHVFEIGGLQKFQGVYYVYGQEMTPDVWMPWGAPTARTMTTHWSMDFVHWSQERAFSFQRHGYRSRDRDLEEAHEPAGVWNRNNVAVGLYGLWHGARLIEQRGMDLGLLVSNDGIHFREPVPDFPFLEAGPAGSWDRHGLIQGQGFENVGDQTYIYYGTWDLASRRISTGEVGLAMMRRDGFGYLSPAENRAASFVTAPLPLPARGASLTLNADGLSEASALEVEVTDLGGRPLPGYGPVRVVRSGIEIPVRWPGGDRVRANVPEVRVRVRFTGADVWRTRFYAAYWNPAGRD